MKKVIILIFFGAIFFQSCTSNVLKDSNLKYLEYKNKFDKNLIRQFPKKIKYVKSNIVCNTNTEKNDVGLLLYEYDVPLEEINKVKQESTKKAVKEYSSRESCLLVINGFETYESYANFELPVIDSLKVNEKCYEGKLPIPNFIDFEEKISKLKIKLNGNFTVYVFEAGKGNKFKNYSLVSSPQMPNSWKNGYSIGTAISEVDRIVIYWSLIW